jgi:hypothetical protein
MEATGSGEIRVAPQAARDHATNLVTLILHGDPHIEEPLAIAWRRALDCLELSGISQEQLPRSVFYRRGAVTKWLLAYERPISERKARGRS